jgi:hypothetical protein
MPAAPPEARRANTRLPAPKEVRVKPVRVTVDLDPAAYDGLRDWAHDARMTHADVLRQLVHLLTTDARVSSLIAAAA